MILVHRFLAAVGGTAVMMSSVAAATAFAQPSDPCRLYPRPKTCETPTMTGPTAKTPTVKGTPTPAKPSAPGRTNTRASGTAIAAIPTGISYAVLQVQLPSSPS